MSHTARRNGQSDTNQHLYHTATQPPTTPPHSHNTQSQHSHSTQPRHTVSTPHTVQHPLSHMYPTAPQPHNHTATQPHSHTHRWPQNRDDRTTVAVQVGIRHERLEELRGDVVVQPLKPRLGHNKARKYANQHNHRAARCRTRDTALWRRRWWKRAEKKKKRKAGRIDVAVILPIAPVAMAPRDQPVITTLAGSPPYRENAFQPRFGHATVQRAPIDREL